MQHKHVPSSADYINACARSREASKPVLHLPPQKAAKPKNNASSVLSDSHRSALTNTLSVYRANCQNESNKKWRMCLFSALKTLTILLRRCYKHHTLWPPLHLLISSLYLQLNTMKASLSSTASLSPSLTITHISREQYYTAGFLLVAYRGCNDSNFSLNQQKSQHLTWNIR